MKGGVSALYVEFEDDRVKELFDDLNDVRKSENLMKKEITQKEVATLLGISQSYISRLEKKIMKRLKRELIREE